MPKLAIYVSKQDMKGIEPWRKQINFSKLFIHAVFDEIRRMQRSSGVSGGKLAAAADYYRAKLTENSGPLTDFGFELGASHVLECQLPPDLIQKLLEARRESAESDSRQNLIEQALGADVRRVEQHAKELGIDEKSNPAWRSAVYVGYLDGVASAWEKVCEKMRESAN